MRPPATAFISKFHQIGPSRFPPSAAVGRGEADWTLRWTDKLEAAAAELLRCVGNTCAGRRAHLMPAFSLLVSCFQLALSLSLRPCHSSCEGVAKHVMAMKHGDRS